MKRCATACLTWLLVLLPVALVAQTKVEIRVDSDYRKLAKQEPIVPDFAGMSFEITSVMPGTGGLAPGVHLFDPAANPQPLALFQQIGIKSLRVGAATGDGCKTPYPAQADLDPLFRFAQQANLSVIYQFRMLNPASCAIPDLAEASARTAQYLWSHYAENIAALSIGNEDDYHTRHTFCTDAHACACLPEKGCACLQGRSACTVARVANAVPALFLRDPAIFEVGISDGMANAGSAFPSYLKEWRKYMGTLTSMAGLDHAPLAGPDAFSYTTESRFTGDVCGSHFNAAAWPEVMAFCEKADPAFNFTASYGHYYVGGNTGFNNAKLTAAQGIADMLSPAWLKGDGVTPEPVQPDAIPPDQKLVYTPYSWLYENDYEPIRKLGMKFRLTESNDHLFGVPGGSNSFASALWALDYMHWWAAHGASGVNFHNNQWIYTDTLVPRNVLWQLPGACSQGPCADYYVTPKGYAIKAFNLGGHGYSIDTAVQVTEAPTDWNLTAYAVGSGTDLYVTVINKMQGQQPEHAAQVTLTPTGKRFAKAGLSAIALSSGVPGDAAALTAQLAGATIANTGEQWRGAWTPQQADAAGRVTLTLPPATAMIVRFHAPGRDVGPIAMNENGALELFAADRQGRLWHTRHAAGNPAEASVGTATRWGPWTDEFSDGLPPVKGGLAVARNQDNTLQVFAATARGIYTAHQKTPGAAWSHWQPLGQQPGLVLTDVQAAQNADGSLSVFAIDAALQLWTATEAAPGVAWSHWKLLPKLQGGVRNGFALAENLNGRIDVFALDGTQHPALWRIGQTLDNDWESRWSGLGAPPSASLRASLQIGRTPQGALTVFALAAAPGRGAANLWSLAQQSPQGAWGHWSPLPVLHDAALRPGFAALQNADGRFEVVAAASDGIRTLEQDPDGRWTRHWTPLRTANAPHLTPVAIVAANSIDGRLQVFTTDENGVVYTEEQQTAGGPWQGRWSAMDTMDSREGLSLLP